MADLIENEAPATFKGVMVALYPPDNVVRYLEDIVGEGPNVIPLEQWHCTLAYIPAKLDEDELNRLCTVVEQFAASKEDLTGEINGFGRFTGDSEEQDTWYASPDVPALPDFRAELIQLLKDNDFEPAENHGFVPHISLRNLRPYEEPPRTRIEPQPVTFEFLSVADDDMVWDFPIGEIGETDEDEDGWQEKAGGLDRNRGGAEKLRHYWTRGEGAAKIRWRTPGDWTRCYHHLVKYMGPRAKGYCALRHREMNGYWPGDKKNKGIEDFGLEWADSITIDWQVGDDAKSEEGAMTIEYKEVGVCGFKVLNESDGIVEAFVSVTGVKDRVNDIIEPGAYEKTLAEREPKGVWSHAWDTPVSRTLEAKELMPGDPDLPKNLPNGEAWPKGAGALRIKTQFNLGTQRGREAYSDVTFFGSKQEWSIGYQVPVGGSQIDSKTGVRRIQTLDLFEYSPVLFGAMPSARTNTVKDAQLAFKTIMGEDLSEWQEKLLDASLDTGGSAPEPKPDHKPKSSMDRTLDRLEREGNEAEKEPTPSGDDDDFNDKHPRHSAGGSDGGKFAKKPDADKEKDSDESNVEPGEGDTSKADEDEVEAPTYTIRPVSAGETLSQIAEDMGVDWHDIYEANKNMIEAAARRHGKESSENGHWIYPGMKLRVPDKKAKAEKSDDVDTEEKAITGSDEEMAQRICDVIRERLNVGRDKDDQYGVYQEGTFDDYVVVCVWAPGGSANKYYRASYIVNGDDVQVGELVPVRLVTTAVPAEKTMQGKCPECGKAHSPWCVKDGEEDDEEDADWYDEDDEDEQEEKALTAKNKESIRRAIVALQTLLEDDEDGATSEEAMDEKEDPDAEDMDEADEEDDEEVSTKWIAELIENNFAGTDWYEDALAKAEALDEALEAKDEEAIAEAASGLFDVMEANQEGQDSSTRNAMSEVAHQVVGAVSEYSDEQDALFNEDSNDSESNYIEGPDDSFDAQDGESQPEMVGAREKSLDAESAAELELARKSLEGLADVIDIKREFTSKEREEAADSGEALPDGSFPIENESDLENAIQAYGRAKNKAAAKRHIIERAKALGLIDKLPDDWAA